MKRKIILCLAALLLFGAVMLLRSYANQPIFKSDPQNGSIAQIIESEFTLPPDALLGRPGIFSEAWPYYRGFVWNAGSTITIYGVHDTGTQDKIVERIKLLVQESNSWDIQVVFYDDSKVEHGENFTHRIEVPELRRERIIGKTESWENLDVE